MPIVGGLDIHRKQITFDYLDTGTGQVRRGQISPADREHLRAWLARFAGREDVAFAVEGCTGWRYVAGELAAAGVTAHLAEPADTAFARGRKRHAKTDKTDCRHLRMLLAEGRLPECWIPPSHILECRALLETYHDLRDEHTAWTFSTMCEGWSRSVSRVPGPPPRTSTLATAPAVASTTVTPVIQPSPMRWWWPTVTPSTSVMALNAPGPFGAMASHIAGQPGRRRGLGDDRLRARLSRASRQRHLAHFTWDVITDQYEQVLAAYVPHAISAPAVTR